MIPREILACYARADAIAAQHLPYVKGGGHPGFGPSSGGYDCSGAVSSVLHAGGILHEPVALTTWGLQNWGLSGQGQYMTVWVVNLRGELEHTFIEFKIPGRHKWFAARHTGTIVGWQSSLLTAGYHARRRKA